MFSPSGELGEPVLRTMSDGDMQDTGEVLGDGGTFRHTSEQCGRYGPGHLDLPERLMIPSPSIEKNISNCVFREKASNILT
ncbi:hypothetical protein INR49_014333 [Caranx melampygus]|nr:hypothetical protein INR49_014333 [Caranx melampygus]